MGIQKQNHLKMQSFIRNHFLKFFNAKDAKVSCLLGNTISFATWILMLTGRTNVIVHTNINNFVFLIVFSMSVFQYIHSFVMKDVNAAAWSVMSSALMFAAAFRIPEHTAIVVFLWTGVILNVWRGLNSVKSE